MKKVENFLTLKIFDLDWGLALRYRIEGVVGQDVSGAGRRGAGGQWGRTSWGRRLVGQDVVGQDVSGAGSRGAGRHWGNIPGAEHRGAGGQWGRRSWGRTSWGRTSLGQYPWGRTSWGRRLVGQDVVGQNFVGQDVAGAKSLGQVVMGQKVLGQEVGHLEKRVFRSGCSKSEAMCAMKDLAEVQSELLQCKRDQIEFIQTGVQKTIKNNNNNKIWSFIKHSNERNLFFMHNCAEILKKTVRKNLTLKEHHNNHEGAVPIPFDSC